jgi:hypothetical protein
MRYRLRTLLIVLAVAPLVLAGGGHALPVALWDGRFDLTVRVSSDPGPPQSVACEAFPSRQYAEYALEHLHPPETQSWKVTADPFAGEPLVVSVPVSGRDSLLGWELSRFQFRHLVVVAVLPDGRRVGKLVDIPDGRVSREVSVSFP